MYGGSVGVSRGFVSLIRCFEWFLSLLGVLFDVWYVDLLVLELWGEGEKRFKG